MLICCRFVDHNKAHNLCLEAQRFYEVHGIKTQVLPASLTSVHDIMALAGVHHITIAPTLLKELAETPASSLRTRSLFDEPVVKGETIPLVKYGSAADWQIAFTRSQDGEGARKLIQVSDSWRVGLSNANRLYRRLISSAICRLILRT